MRRWGLPTMFYYFWLSLKKKSKVTSPVFIFNSKWTETASVLETGKRKGTCVYWISQPIRWLAVADLPAGTCDTLLGIQLSPRNTARNSYKKWAVSIVRIFYARECCPKAENMMFYVLHERCFSAQCSFLIPASCTQEPKCTYTTAPLFPLYPPEATFLVLDQSTRPSDIQ